MPRKPRKTETTEQVEDLRTEMAETVELLESKDKRISELETELAAYKNHFGKLPIPAKPEPVLIPTCCHKDQKDCRMFDRNNIRCLKLRIPIDPKKPKKDCDHFRKPLPL